MFFEEKVYTRLNDFDSAGRMHPSALLAVMENVGEDHTRAVGAALEPGTAWVMTDWDVEICRCPASRDSLKGKTWSMSEGNAPLARRGYVLSDGEGREIVRAVSSLALIDTATGRMVRIGRELMEPYKPETLPVFEGKRPRLRMPESYDLEREFSLRRSDIDYNGHVHNTRYVDFAMEMLDDDCGPIRAFRVTYRSAVKYGEAVTLKCSSGQGEKKVGVFSGDKLCTIVWLSF